MRFRTGAAAAALTSGRIETGQIVTKFSVGENTIEWAELRQQASTIGEAMAAGRLPSGIEEALAAMRVLRDGEKIARLILRDAGIGIVMRGGIGMIGSETSRQQDITESGMKRRADGEDGSIRAARGQKRRALGDERARRIGGEV